MTLVKWDEAKYSVGDATINNQHKKLVDLINDLHDSMKEGKSKESVPRVIDELVQYTRDHFSHEEQHMANIKYPRLAEHKEEHAEFIRKIEEFRNDFKAGRVGLNFQIINFLKDWLIGHIQHSDKEYKKFKESLA